MQNITLSLSVIQSAIEAPLKLELTDCNGPRKTLCAGTPNELILDWENGTQTITNNANFGDKTLHPALDLIWESIEASQSARRRESDPKKRYEMAINEANSQDSIDSVTAYNSLIVARQTLRDNLNEQMSPEAALEFGGTTPQMAIEEFARDIAELIYRWNHRQANNVRATAEMNRP